MNAAVSRLLLVAVSVGAFLAAAKAHGHQLRIERQLAGYWDVTFGAQNAPWVEALWWRERATLWGVGIGLGVAAIAYRAVASRRGWPVPLAEAPWLSAAWMFLAVPAVGAFTAGGLWSAGRFAAGLFGAAAPEWVPQAAWMAAAWWAATAACSAGSAYLALRRRQAPAES